MSLLQTLLVVLTTAILLSWQWPVVDGFVTQNGRNLIRSHRTVGETTPTTVAAFRRIGPPFTSTENRRRNTRRYVFERMSEDCIGAIVTAQKQAEKFGQRQVQLPCLLAGVVDLPETAAMDRTFKQFGVTWRKAVRALEAAYPDTGDGDGSKSGGLGSFFRARDPDDDLPFGADVQKTLKKAGSIADSMESTTVQPQHLFLAMMEYQPGDEAIGKSAKAATDSTTNGALFVLVTIDPAITALDMCQSLLGHMEEMGAQETERDLVTGLGGQAAMKTLDECGVDLTLQAQDGLLDPVQGRDKEIGSCIRTLVRRRKNNVCLIGEAGA